MLEGDNCTVIPNVRGTCKQLQNCPRAVIEKNLNRTLLYCTNKEEVNPLVCCPKLGSVSEQKCEEYGKKVAQMIKVLLSNSRCGLKHRIRFIRTIIVSEGKNADPGEFSHMAMLGYGNEERKFWICGGSLISHQYVLTAAHCSYHQQSGSLAKWVRLGALNRDEKSEGNFNIKEIIKHPLYKPPIKYHDIALILLDKKVVFSKYIWPACLNTAPIFDTNKELIATGWGSLGEGQGLANILQKVNLQQFSKNECQKSYLNISSLRQLPEGITDSFICAGDRNGGKDTCSGDSGGPLQVNHEKLDYMLAFVGITAFGKTNCGQPGIPGVYTKVSDYIEWIENIVWM